jgi:hypothetical protein
MVPPVIGLAVRAPGWILSYSNGYKRAKKEFRKQLINQGVPSEEAYELAELYPFKMSDFWDLARSNN